MKKIEVTIDQMTTLFARTLTSKRKPTIGMLSRPGIGKSTIVKNEFRQAYAKQLGLPVDDIGLVVYECTGKNAADAAGMVMPSKLTDQMLQTFPQYAGMLTSCHVIPPVIQLIINTGKTNGILFFDEYLQGEQSMQKVLTPALNSADHSIAGCPIPEGWRVVFASNHVTDHAGATRMMSHIPSRVKLFCLEFSMAALDAYWLANGLNPVLIETAKQHEQNGFFTTTVVENEPSCCPRSLETASSTLDVIMSEPTWSGELTALDMLDLAADIGENATRCVQQYLQSLKYNVPTGAEILANPNGVTVPQNMGFQQVSAHSAMQSIRNSNDAESVLQYITRLTADLQVPMGAKLLRMAEDKGWFLNRTQTGQNFIVTHHELTRFV